jgi:hypothetical protein
MADAQASFSSPNLLLTKDRIHTVKACLKAGDPLITTAYKQLIADADGNLKVSPNPIAGELRVPGFYKKPEEQRKVVGRLKPDAKAANCLALAYALSGDAKYGVKAKEFLFAWVNTLGKPRDGGNTLDRLLFDQRGDTRLAITYTFPNFIYAFDIISGLGLLSEQEEASFRKWLKVYVDYCTTECVIKNNHHNWQSLFLMCAGHALQDKALFDRGVDYYKRGFRVQLAGDGAMPLELMREEKAATYTLMALEAMVQVAHIAMSHGHEDILEIRSNDKANLKDAIDCLISFLNDPDNWQTKARKRYSKVKMLNRPDNTSDWGWVLELPHFWRKDESYFRHMAKRPYGDGIRTYTLTYSTILFASVR